jgi:N-methylhydantoinase A
MRLGIDVGGTFTDFVLIDAAGRRFGVGKVLTTSEDPSRAILDGAVALAREHGITIGDLLQAVHGTTLVANTIIERKGARTGLITTKGFRDALETGREIRYDMYDLSIARPEPIVPRYLRLEIDERLSHDGTVLRDLDLGGLETIRKVFETEGVEAVAVSLMHAFRNAAHERAIAARLAECASTLPISLSTDVCPEIREYDRTSTTVANAYVQPIVARYLKSLEDRMRAAGLRAPVSIMLSSGGINTIDYARRMPVQMIESGPAGGAITAAFIGRRAGIDRLLAFDMGGTTAKLCLVDNCEPHRVTTFEAARVHRFMKGSGLLLKLPVVEMIEIGAGGGSIARADRLGTLKVGPRSAGAAPGPACYDRGGTEPTVTDADLLMGLLDPDYFLGGRMALDRDRATRAVADHVARPLELTPSKAARGIFEVVNENMAAAARVYLAERGKDPREYTLLAFGGAGPVHGWDVARRLKIRRLLCPPAAGAASALGFLVAPPTVDLVASHVARLHDFDSHAAGVLISAMQQQATAILASCGVATGEISFEIAAEMRYVGQGYEIPVPISPHLLNGHGGKAIAAAFDAEYERAFGRAVAGVPAEILTWRVRAIGPEPAADWPTSAHATGEASLALKGQRPVLFGEESRDTPVFDRYRLGPGAEVRGPAIVEERESTAVVPPEGIGTIDARGNLLIELG